MWPLEPWFERRRDVIRVGRERVERWRPSAEGLVLRDQRVATAHDGQNPEVLRAALQDLLGADIAGSADVVLESAWLPLMLLDVGTAPWSSAKLQALLRHRLGELYGQASINAWDLLLDYRPGDAKALGYGLAPEIKQAVVDAAAAAGQKLASVQPAFQWAARRLKPQKRTEGWWLWLEQDRALLARVRQGRVVHLNAAAPLPRDEADSTRLAGIEARRRGEADQDRATVTAGWSAPWISVAAA